MNTDTEMIDRQERDLSFTSFDSSVAWELGNIARELCLDRDAGLCIQIRRFDQILFHSSVGAATRDNDSWVERKAALTRRFQRSSLGFALELRSSGYSLGDLSLSGDDYAAAGGSFPISVNGVGVVGNIAVSGLEEREDHEIAVRAVCDFLKMDFSNFRLPSLA